MASIKIVRPGVYKVTSEFQQDGVRHQRTRTLRSLSAAKAHRDKVALDERRSIGTVKLTLGEYLTGWIETKAKDVERNTLAGYQRWAGHIGRCKAAGVALDRLTPLELERLYSELQAAPGGRGKPLSPQSIRHCHALLQNALGDAVRHQRITANPALNAKPPKGKSPKVGVPSPEQVAALIRDLEQYNPDMVDLALVIIGTGLRRSEVLGLAWGDISWDSRQITIRQVVIEHAGQWSIRPGTKSIAGSRTIGIAADVVDALKRQQARVAEWRLKLGRFWHDHDLVFPALDGDPKAPAAVTKAFTRAARRAGWPAHSSPVHSLRHAAASHALAAGVDLAAISKRLGHSSVAVTAKVYLSAGQEQDRRAAEAMAAIPRIKASRTPRK
jgi:integrase